MSLDIIFFLGVTHKPVAQLLYILLVLPSLEAILKSERSIRLFLAILSVILLAPPALYAVARLYTPDPFFIDELPAMILAGCGLISLAGFLRFTLKK